MCGRWRGEELEMKKKNIFGGGGRQITNGIAFQIYINLYLFCILF